MTWSLIDDTPQSAIDTVIALREVEALERVKAAIRQASVQLAFQPVVAARDTSRITFYEALARVPDENGRMLHIPTFLPAIEETEYGRLLDCASLKVALEELSLVPDLRLSVNMSARSIGYREWVRTLDTGLNRDPTVAERLILEMTERSAIRVPELVIDFMHDLQRRGISFALDEFGAGHTSLRHFRNFSFDMLKIDGGFCRHVDKDPDNQVLVEAILSIADHFDMYTVAEHVETPGEAAKLTALGVNCLQGYAFGPAAITPPWRNDRDSRHFG